MSGSVDRAAMDVEGRGLKGRTRGVNARRTGWRRWVLRSLAVLTLAALLAATSACGQDEGAAASRDLRVFAAASLTEAFTELGDAFMAEHPDVKVTFVFGASSDLARQIEEGAQADVLATADKETMAGVADAVDPQVFVRNRLTIVVAPGDPLAIHALEDLAKPDVKVVLAAPEVPAGRYAERILDGQGVVVEPVSYEATVKSVVTKVSLGEADAGIAYVTDVAAAGGEVDEVPIPIAENVIAAYPIATLAGSQAGAEAQAFVDFVLSDAGQKIMKTYGFLPRPTAR